MLKNGYTLWLSSMYCFDLINLIKEVKEIKNKMKTQHGNNFVTFYNQHPKVKKLCAIRVLMKEDIPNKSPDHPDYRATPPIDNVFRRAKPYERDRIFFQYCNAQKIIVYLWFNGDGVTRKRKDKNDVYAYFNSFVKRNIIGHQINSNKYKEFEEPTK